MQTIHSDSLWTEIEQLARASRYRVADVAYATDDELVQFGKGDLLVVDASDRAIRGLSSRETKPCGFDSPQTAQKYRNVAVAGFQSGESRKCSEFSEMLCQT